MNMLKRYRILLGMFAFTCMCVGCNPFGIKKENASEIPTDEFLLQVEPYLAEGESIDEISTVPPAPGYLSETEVLKRVAQDFISRGMLNLEYKQNINGEDIVLDQSWLKDTRFHVPITVHNFNTISTADTPHGYDYYYVLHASHPEMGSVCVGVYTYNANTGNNVGLGMLMGPAINQLAHKYYRDWDNNGYKREYIISRRQAREFFSRTVSKSLRGDPIAIHYPYKGPMDKAAFQWYFETDARNGDMVESYLMDAFISMPSTTDLADPVEYMARINANYRSSGAVTFGGTPLPTLICKLPEPLGLYDALEIQSRNGRQQSLRELVPVRILGRDDFIPVR